MMLNIAVAVMTNTTEIRTWNLPDCSRACYQYIYHLEIMAM